MLFTALSLLLFCGPAGAGDPPRYFITVLNGARDIGADGARLAESYKVLENMVKLADAQGVRLTLLFGARYALYISSSPERVTALDAWRKTGHEIGGWHAGPDSGDWDGYSDLPETELRGLRPGRPEPGAVPGSAEYLAALAGLGPRFKSACFEGAADEAFLSAAAPPYDACAPAAARGARAGVNEYLSGGGAGGRKGLSAFRPADREGLAAAERVFSSLSGGVYGASFRSEPGDFGAYYAWLAFLRSVDPLGVKSRTVAAAVDSGLLPEKNPDRKTARTQKKRGSSGPEARPVPAGREVSPPAARGEAPQKQYIPKLKPVPSFFGSVSRMMFGRGRGMSQPAGRCGDGICDLFERAKAGRCPRDCGN